MNIQERVELYNRTFGEKYPGSRLAMCGRDTFSGVWVLGNNYKGSGYYGAYPPQYLARVMKLFPDAAGETLHVFAGSVPKAPQHVTFDIAGGADVTGDAEVLAKHFRRKFKLVLADPPYTVADALRYGSEMVDRRKVMLQIAEVMRPGGLLVWLDTVWPMVRKKVLRLVGEVLILRSCNHRVRCTFFFERQ